MLGLGPRQHGAALQGMVVPSESGGPECARARAQVSRHLAALSKGLLASLPRSFLFPQIPPCLEARRVGPGPRCVDPRPAPRAVPREKARKRECEGRAVGRGGLPWNCSSVPPSPASLTSGRTRERARERERERAREPPPRSLEVRGPARRAAGRAAGGVRAPRRRPGSGAGAPGGGRRRARRRPGARRGRRALGPVPRGNASYLGRGPGQCLVGHGLDGLGSKEDSSRAGACAGQGRAWLFAPLSFREAVTFVYDPAV